jgi:hypothetical protein
MRTHKEDLQTLEDMMLNYYYSTVKEGKKFTLFVFFDLLSKMESDPIHSQVLNNLDISEQEVLILCKRVRQKIEIFKNIKTIYTCHHFIAN